MQPHTQCLLPVVQRVVWGVTCAWNRPLRGSYFFLISFKWRHTVDPKAKRPWIAPSRPRDDQRRNYNDCCSRCARGISNGTGHNHQSRILMIVHPVTATDHAVGAVTEAALGPRTAPNPATMWRVVVRTVMWLGVVHPAPAMPLSSKETDMVGQGLWYVNLEL